jgi:hypothetical protein
MFECAVDAQYRYFIEACDFSAQYSETDAFSAAQLI